MKKTHISLLGVVLLTSLIVPVYAQSKVEIQIYRLFSSTTNEWGDGEIEHTWHLFFKDNYDADYHDDYRCHSKNTAYGVTNIWHTVNDVYIAKSYYNTVPQTLYFHLRGYEDDAGSRCEENGRDENKESSLYSIAVANLTPGVWSQQYSFGSSNYSIEFAVRYTPIAPTVESISPNTGLICADVPVTLTSAIDIPNASGLSYQWQFNIQGEDQVDPLLSDCVYECFDMRQRCEMEGWGRCQEEYLRCVDVCNASYPTTPVWKNLGPGNTASITVQPLSAIFPGGINSNTGVQFRVKAYTTEVSSAYGPSSGFRSFSPPAPTSSTSPMVVNAACLDGGGVIRLENIVKVFSSYHYILKKGDIEKLGCEPQTGDCLGDVVTYGESTSSTLVIEGLPAETYSLFLLNPGGDEGVCPQRIGKAIVVPMVPQLKVTPGTPSIIACHGASDGGIQIAVSGGDQSLINYTLSNTTNPRSWSRSTTTTNPTLSFSDLSPGDYVIEALDGCTERASAPFQVLEYAEITEAGFDEAPATCNVPGNGAVQVQVARSSGSHVTSFSTTLSYALYKDGSADAFRIQETTGTSISWGSLPPGNYRLVVNEKGSGACNQYEKIFVIDRAASLAINDAAVKNVSCFNGNDGQISFTAAGGTGSYTFLLSGELSASSTTPKFTGLKAGRYSITVKNQLAGCEDFFTTSYVVSQPSELMVTVSKTDITCFDQNDGKLASTVQGGQPGYEYTWQTEINTNWTDMSVSEPTVEGRWEGDYRLIVKDANQCTTVSNVVTIIRPKPLQIDSVKLFDIKCLGETGAIEVYSAGGTEPHKFEYAKDGSAAFTAFTPTSPLSAGTYNIRVKDTNGCVIAPEGATYEITSPESALAFTFEQSDYYGYNVSCHNGANGSIVITPSGGNGALYSGYEFRAEDRVFSESDSLTDLNAGAHLIAVRDGRGCVLEKTIDFTEAPALAVKTRLKQDVDCYGDSTGVIELEVGGGAGTFHYELGNVTQDDPRFENLHAADYTFNIVDDNKCAIVYNETIVNLHEPITSEVEVSDVLCHDGNDGSIALTVLGGAPAGYDYELVGAGDRLNPVDGLSAGTYNVIVRDMKGCELEVKDILVAEPDALLIDSVRFNDIVCYQGTGSIKVFSSGGTPTHLFQYSLDEGLNFTPFTETTALEAGSYHLRVVDEHNCLTPYVEVVNLTSPSQPLDFGYSLSNYNGYNISCFGGNNGYVEIAPSGGNGASYSGYEFALDDRTFQESIRIDQVTAGLHQIQVRDARGCVITKDALFTQSNNRLDATVFKKTDVNCFYEQNGAVEVLAEGGVSPYKYWIDASQRQDTPQFNGLAVGAYTITIHDINACETLVDFSIASINPAFSLVADVTEVNCHGGQDGSVNMNVSGGVAPFSFAWKNFNESSGLLQQVATGTYEVTVTDNAGCYVTEFVEVDEPDESLSVTEVTALSACYDQSNGMITIAAIGGTSPYRYSIDKGQTYYESASINAPAGTFDILVEDLNGCFTESLVTVGQRNNRPEPNFLVSSKQNALDTLLLTDISIPKPDSISWVFDPNALLLNDSQSTPEISFVKEGNYPVTMIGYFGDCAYEVTKTVFLKPFDPNRAEDDLPDVSPITSIEVMPNPNTGVFTARVKLNRPRSLSLIVYSVTGNILYANSYEETGEVAQEIDISDNASGLYVIRAVTDTDAREVRIVVNH